MDKVALSLTKTYCFPFSFEKPQKLGGGCGIENRPSHQAVYYILIALLTLCSTFRKYPAFTQWVSDTHKVRHTHVHPHTHTHRPSIHSESFITETMLDSQEQKSVCGNCTVVNFRTPLMSVDGASLLCSRRKMPSFLPRTRAAISGCCRATPPLPGLMSSC